MHASWANLEALYCIELGVKASSQCDCSAARVLAPHQRLDIAVNSSNVARKPILFGVVNQKAFNIVVVYLIIKLSVKYYPYTAQKKSCVFGSEASRAG